MLLDRKRIRKWAKWIALALAVIFALSFLFLGIGYGGAGFNLSEIFSGGCSDTTEPDTVQTQLDGYLAAIQADPKNAEAMLGAADIYQSMYRNGEGEGQQYLMATTALLEQAIGADPSLKDVYLRLANLYLNEYQTTAATEKAVTVLNGATAVDPNNPEIYLKLGSAQRSLGRTEAAVLAWQKYLALAPNGEYAELVREQLESLTAGNTTTTTGAATTTTTLPASPTTSAATTSTTG